jgi:tetratricopeptide (TPR) repeat protein
MLLAILQVGAIAFRPRAAHADASGRDAGRHFQRGVELYNDGDFRGALVEFKRAYVLLPRATVLYDIGETEYQLQDYAKALSTLRRFLQETGPNALHRAEVEVTVETLRGRVGKVALNTDAAGCEVSIEDQPVGLTPLPAPLAVSVGPRKLAVACAGRPVVVRMLEIAGGETTRVDLNLVPPATPGAELKTASAPVTRENVARSRRQHLTLAWTFTAVLAAGAVGLGAAALIESSRLKSMKQTFPVDRTALDRQATLTTALAITTDVVGAVALAAAALSTYVTVRERRAGKSLHLAVAPGYLGLSAAF